MRRCRRAAGAIALATATVAATAGGSPGCGGGDDATAVVRDGSSDVAVAPDVGDALADAPYASLPYPPGPYGPGLGQVMPDFRVEGYALSREHRDSRYLPWRDVTVSDVRSMNPSCTCMAILVNAVGTQCPPCLFEDETLAAAMAGDPTLCAIEAILLNFDGIGRYDAGNADARLPTRADLDVFTQSLRQDYPVGIVTESSSAALSTAITDTFPFAYAVRASDMRVSGLLLGAGKDLGPALHGLCDAPTPPPETLVSGLAARKMLLDGDAAWLADDAAGVVRVDLGAAAPYRVRTFARPGGTPVALAADATHVYWATGGAGVAFQLGRVAKTPEPDGGTPLPEVLDASTSAFAGAAVDASYMYFTRSDGVVGRVPIGGGAEEALFTGESAPGAIVVDDTGLTWVTSGGGDVVRGGKTGGGRASLLEPGFFPADVTFRDLALDGDLVLAFATVADRHVWGLVGLKKAVAPVVDLGLGAPGDGAFAVAPDGSVVAATRDDVLGLGKIVSRRPPTIQDSPTILTFGEPHVTAIAADVGHVYWLEAASGSLRRMKR